MKNISSVDSLAVIIHNNIPVITTELLAGLYGSEPKLIRQNYQRNNDRFIAGKHYFKIEGLELKEFKSEASKRGFVKIAPTVNHLLLWTERGAARHAKMLETDQAWEVFEKLEDCYFSQSQRTENFPAPCGRDKLIDLAVIAWGVHRDMDRVLDCFNQRKPGWDNEVFWRLMTMRSNITELGWGMVRLAGFPN